MQDVVTSDLSRFGFRELAMAGKLLTAYASNPSSVELGDGVTVNMNSNSRNVFLTDEDYAVAMMNGDTLENFFSCPECGHEGFLEEMGPNAGHDADDRNCREYMAQIGIEFPEQCAYEDGMVTYTRCTRPVASGKGMYEIEKSYCDKHAEFEPKECAECGGETSDFQDRNNTHEHETEGAAH